MSALTTRYSLRPLACGCSLRATASGPFVRYNDHIEELATERLRTQRAMVAALYWRAGELHLRASLLESDPSVRQIVSLFSMKTRAITTEQNARAMERAL